MEYPESIIYQQMNNYMENSVLNQPKSTNFIVKKASKGLEYKQAYLFNHIKTKGYTGFLNDVIITFIGKTDASDPTKRK